MQARRLEEEVAALKQELAEERESMKSAQTRAQDLEREAEAHKRDHLTALQEVPSLLHTEGKISFYQPIGLVGPSFKGARGREKHAYWFCIGKLGIRAKESSL